MATILLSEADPDVRRLLIVLLNRLGHEPVVLGSGSTSTDTGDLLLLEPASPACLEQARAVRERQPEIPIICVSILPSEAWFSDGGPPTYLAKPFTLEQLDAALDAALEASALPI